MHIKLSSEGFSLVKSWKNGGLDRVATVENQLGLKAKCIIGWWEIPGKEVILP